MRWRVKGTVNEEHYTCISHPGRYKGIRKQKHVTTDTFPQRDLCDFWPTELAKTWVIAESRAQFQGAGGVNDDQMWNRSTQD